MFDHLFYLQFRHEPGKVCLGFGRLERGGQSLADQLGLERLSCDQGQVLIYLVLLLLLDAIVIVVVFAGLYEVDEFLHVPAESLHLLQTIGDGQVEVVFRFVSVLDQVLLEQLTVRLVLTLLTPVLEALDLRI